MRRLLLILLLGIPVLAPAPAAASYAAPSAPQLWTVETWSYVTSDPPHSDAVVTGSTSLISCGSSTGSQLCQFGRPTLSPDGGSVIVSRHEAAQGVPIRSSGPGALVILDMDGTSPRTVPQLTASDTQPAFLPGGRRIVFTGRRTAKTPSQLYEANLDGTALKQLTFRGGSWAAPCSSGAIVFQRGRDLWLIPARGSRWRRLVRDASQPDCAPNGRQVVFVVSATNHSTSRAGLVGLDGRHERILPHGHGADEEPDRPGFLTTPAFSPDGRRIAYLRSYDVPQQDGSRNELDVSELGGRILSRRDIADQAGGSIGSDADQSLAQYLAW